MSLNCINLPDVTLCCVETREHELARLAIQDCKRKARFGDVLIFTDKPEMFADEGRVIKVEDFPDKLSWSRFRWHDIAPHLGTSHMLYTEWDAWIFDPAMWDDKFLDYDYVGAPWWYEDYRNVGNGGFHLRSTRLSRYLRRYRKDYPCTTFVDDNLLCRKYRPDLEKVGFVWAPQKLAKEFAFECVVPGPVRAFGFHGMFNWHHVLNDDELTQRAEIAVRSDYIRNKRMWSAFVKNNAKIAERLVS